MESEFVVFICSRCDGTGFSGDAHRYYTAEVQKDPAEKQAMDAAIKTLKESKK